MTTAVSALFAAPIGADEYAEWYAGYVAQSGGDPVALLAAQPAEMDALLGGLDETGGAFRYAPGKWSVKDVVVHLSDAERVFAYRLMRIARGDATPLASFDENAYAAAAQADARPLADVRAEWRAVRGATLALVAGLDAAMLARRGTASGYPVSARALVRIVAGHTAHHLAVLRERYGLGRA